MEKNIIVRKVLCLVLLSSLVSIFCESPTNSVGNVSAQDITGEWKAYQIIGSDQYGIDGRVLILQFLQDSVFRTSHVRIGTDDQTMIESVDLDTNVCLKGSYQVADTILHLFFAFDSLIDTLTYTFRIEPAPTLDTNACFYSDTILQIDSIGPNGIIDVDRIYYKVKEE